MLFFSYLKKQIKIDISVFHLFFVQYFQNTTLSQNSKIFSLLSLWGTGRDDISIIIAVSFLGFSVMLDSYMGGCQAAPPLIFFFFSVFSLKLLDPGFVAS